MTRGIDVSYAQGMVDWAKVKAAGIEFAFLRSGYGWDNDRQMDRQFMANVAGCKEQKISYGVYHYSYAESPEDAAKEALFCLRLMEKAGVDTAVPVAYDLEESFQLAYSDQTLLKMVDAFCEVIDQAGHYPVVYASASTMNRLYKVGLEALGIMVWVAHWDVEEPNYLGTWDFWQYSAKGRVAGIQGDVDLDYGSTLVEESPESDDIAKLHKVIAEYKEAITAYEAERNKVVYLVEQLAATLGITPIQTMSLRRTEPPDSDSDSGFASDKWEGDREVVDIYGNRIRLSTLKALKERGYYDNWKAKAHSTDGTGKTYGEEFARGEKPAEEYEG